MQELLKAINFPIEKEIVQEIRASPYFSLILDEATDLSTSKQLGVAVKYIAVDTGHVKCRFLKMLDMSRYIHADATNIFDCLTQFLKDPGSNGLIPEIPIANLAATATDGASVMMGKENGVVSRLKRIVPAMVGTHCAAHRLALAVCEAAKSVKWFESMEKSINAIYTHFSRSSTLTAQLHEMQSVLNMPQLALQRPTSTRWLSIGYSVKALRRNFKAVNAVLEEEASRGEPVAMGLTKQMQDPAYIISLHLLSDILETLNELSLVFQKKDLNLLHVKTIVNAKLAALEKLEEDVYSGGYMIKAKDDFPEQFRSCKHDHFAAKAKEFLSKIICKVQRRFPNVENLSLLGLLLPQNARRAKHESIMNLARNFGIDEADFLNEFRSYQTLQLEHLPESIDGIVACMWNTNDSSEMTTASPLVSKILARLIVMPGSSAEVERVLSTMKRIKTPIRNRLASTTVDWLIRITMEGVEYKDWNPTPALKFWVSQGRRRITSIRSRSIRNVSNEGVEGGDESDFS